MIKATFKVEKINQNINNHIFRSQGINYSITNQNHKNSFKKFYEYDDFLQKASTTYKEKIKQNMQKSAILNLFQEALIAIENNHDENSIINLFKTLNEKFGGHELINLTIHKDEGYFLKDNIRFYPYKNILKKGENWYVCKNFENGKIDEDFSIKVDISSFEKILTPHAHAIFSMFDFKLGRNARMQKKDMVERLKIVANSLNMPYSTKKEFEENYNIETKEIELIELNNQINLKNSQLFDIKNKFATTELELEELNSKFVTLQNVLQDIQNKISQKESEFQDLISLIAQKEENLDSLKDIISIKNAEIQTLETKIKQKEFKLDELEIKISSKTSFAV